MVPETAVASEEKAVTSQLTDQEIEISRTADLDLGAGYPQITLPPWLKGVLHDQSQHELAYSFSPAVAPGEVVGLTDDLLVAVCHRLGISPSHAENGFVTFSGSIALDRALESQLAKGTSVITTSPSIDIIASMISERGGVTAIFVPTGADFSIDVDQVIAAIRDDTNCIILTSPENPTGHVLDEDALARLARASADRGVTLILDHCFALIDPFRRGIPLLPNVAPPELSWICVWDTGKTFGLNEEKLGFLFCSTNLREDLRQRVNILQFDVSRRQKILFRRVLDRSIAERYEQQLSDLVARNIGLAEQACADLPLRALRPQAGSLLLLDVTPSGSSGAAWSERLLHGHGLGVVRGGNFFLPQQDPVARHDGDGYLRLAMARDPAVIEEAFGRIRAACQRGHSATSRQERA